MKVATNSVRLASPSLGYPKNIKAYNAFKQRFEGHDPAIHRVLATTSSPPVPLAPSPRSRFFVGIGGKGSGSPQFFKQGQLIPALSPSPVPYCKSSTVHDNPAALFAHHPHSCRARVRQGEERRRDNYETRIVELRRTASHTSVSRDLLDFTNAAVVSICEKNGVEATVEGIAGALRRRHGLGHRLRLRPHRRHPIGRSGHPDPFVQVMLLGEYEFKGCGFPPKDYMIGWFRFTADFEGFHRYR